MAVNKYAIQKLNPRVKVETDERGHEFVTDPETGRTFHYSGIAKNLEEALAWVIEKREEEKLREKYPGATFLQGNA